LGECEDEVDLYLDTSQTKLSRRWNRFATDKAVYVNENCVPATAFPIDGKEVLYCVAANTLEVRGGGIRVEGLTLLPSGPLFLLLTRLSFGLQSAQTEHDNASVEEDCVRWLWMMNRYQTNSLSKERKEELEVAWRKRINMAFDFHERSHALGENLECFPDMANALKLLFDGVGGCESHDDGWDFQSDLFTRKNLRSHKKGRQPTRAAASVHEIESNSSADAGILLHPKTEQNRLGNLSSDVGQPTCPISSRKKLDSTWLDNMQHLFLTQGPTVSEHELPSTNLLALVIEHVHYALLGTTSDPNFVGINRNRLWTLYGIEVEGRKGMLFQAKFASYNLFSSEAFDDVSDLPAWHYEFDRPKSLDHALECVPDFFRGTVLRTAITVRCGSSASKFELFFTSVEVALRMEAAFWLEWQFSNSSQHWYEQGDVAEMISRLLTECRSLDQFADAA